MPELPEVETVRRGLQRWMVGRTVSSLQVFGPRTLRRHAPGPADFIARIEGRTVVAACRRGKYLWLPLSSPGASPLVAGPPPRSPGASPLVATDSDSCIVAHLGMSGQFLAVEKGTPDPPHLRARFRFDDDGPEIRFVDQRTFGGLALEMLDDASAPPPSVAHIAVDPIDPAFDRDAVHTALRRRRTGLKRALLDQTLVSGIGNIYADESLWRARLHYARASESLRRNETERLLDAVDEVLRAAIAAGGTSFDEMYVAVNGESGWFERSLEVYGREGEPCSRCGAAIRREAFMNRSSYRCPRCQRVPRGGAVRW
ncbi:MAG TPA: bifunctional DNA-formamidopyrimidine glycosylase/DNA-(apurinic or apyrimidinic site) lyase [Mycobacteriales bacterium]|nr:bifunctional DNA-formamidopyrimidine glycosylase/DNA-(apurinic or apyrimidinic site) lyase [Mycobacteriales bacterium]